MSKRSYKELEKELNEFKKIDIESLKDESYKILFDSRSEMVEIIELIYNERNQPVDFYMRNISLSFAKLLKKPQEELINKKISSIISTLEDHWLTSFAYVEKTGKTLSFKNYGAEFDKYYFVTVWKISKKRVGVSLTDITKNERIEIELKKKLEKEKKENKKTKQLLKEKELEIYTTIKNLEIASAELAFQNEEKEKRADELVLANTELAFQNKEKDNRAYELVLANKELAFQNEEKEKRADELAIANEELAYQNKEKEKRADELAIANEELAYQNKEKEKRADELALANKELAYQNKEKDKRADELVLANKELAFQNKEKEKRADELSLADKELAFQYKEKEKRADELALANKELAFQNKEKDNRADELVLANKELAFQNKEKEKRADELAIANKELAFQNEEKGKRADELAIAKKELIFQKELDSYRSEAERVAHELTLLIDTANAPIFGIDSKGLVNEWNQTSEKITGFKKDEVLGQKLVQTYITKDYRKSVKKVLDDALLGKETANYEFPLFSKDGERVMVLLNSSTRRDANGKITGVLGVGQDISEMDKLRTVSESIAKELRQFIETANAPIFGIDSKGLVNEWNQTSEKITGFKKDEVLGKNLVQTYITEDYRKSVKKVLDDALRGKETANYEFPLFTKNGERVMVLLNSSSRRDANGKIIGVLGVGQDITELVGYRDELEIKVEERTIKLNQALEKQKELNELKSKFVSTASHEFRTPLSAINFAAGSIKKYWGKMEPVMVEKKLHKIEDQVMHMTRLLDDVLVIGQAGAGEIRNNPLNMPLGNFINEIIEEVYTSHKKSNKIVVIDTENIKNETIFIDEKLGRNIFINLISNAVKYSKNKENVTIAFSSEKDFIIITVTDSGIGISKSELKTIFTPFSRGEHVDLIQGTGLGLSIAKEAIDAIGGEIIVSSKIGHGASFKVKVPKNKNNV